MTNYIYIFKVKIKNSCKTSTFLFFNNILYINKKNQRSKKYKKN